MSSLEIEIRGYIIIFGIAFMVGILSGCGNTISGIGQDVVTVGKKVTLWQEKQLSEKDDEKVPSSITTND